LGPERATGHALEITVLPIELENLAADAGRGWSMQSNVPRTLTICRRAVLELTGLLMIASGLGCSLVVPYLAAEANFISAR
jgi:hypothetical protein